MVSLHSTSEIPQAAWVLASRASNLAKAQVAEVVRALRPLLDEDQSLVAHYVTTRGDKILDRSLKALGDGGGLFTSEVDAAVLNHEARLAVHSAKDLPAALDERLCIAAVMPRRWRADAFISKTAATLDALPAAAQVGTASLRRAAQLKALHPQLCVKLIRGNLDSRLAKLDAGGYDALILAQAGVTRLGYENRIQMLLDPRHFVPPAGQGALAVVARRDDQEARTLLGRMDDPESRLMLESERYVMAALGASCQQALGVSLHLEGERAWLDLFHAQPDLSQPRWFRFEGQKNRLPALLSRAIAALTEDAAPEDAGQALSL